MSLRGIDCTTNIWIVDVFLAVYAPVSEKVPLGNHFSATVRARKRKQFFWNNVAAVLKMQILFYGIWYKTKSLEILTRNQKFSKKFRNCNQNVWQHLMLRIYCTRCPRKTTFFDIATAFRRQCKVVFLTKTTQIYRICCPLWLSREMRQVL